MSLCPVQKPIFWCHNFKILGKKVGKKWYKICTSQIFNLEFFPVILKNGYSNLTLLKFNQKNYIFKSNLTKLLNSNLIFKF